MCLYASASFAQKDKTAESVNSLQPLNSDEKSSSNFKSEIFASIPNYSNPGSLVSTFDPILGIYKGATNVDLNKVYPSAFLRSSNISPDLISPCPVLLNSDGSLLNSDPSLFIEATTSKLSRISEGNFESMVLKSQFMFLPVLKGGMSDVLSIQLYQSNLFNHILLRSSEIVGAGQYIYNIQVEFGNVCILDDDGIPSYKNLPALEDPNSLDKISSELRKKYYFSLFRRWMCFYPEMASNSLKKANIDVSNIQNEDQLWKTVNPSSRNIQNTTVK